LSAASRTVVLCSDGYKRSDGEVHLGEFFGGEAGRAPPGAHAPRVLHIIVPSRGGRKAAEAIVSYTEHPPRWMGRSLGRLWPWPEVRTTWHLRFLDGSYLDVVLRSGEELAARTRDLA
jgi:hypothetical protein